MIYVNAPRYLLRKHLVMKLLEKAGGPCRVLEIGFGAGDLLATLFQRGYDVLGVDTSPEAVTYCQNAWKELAGEERFQIRQQNFTDLDERYDRVLLFEVLEHVEDDLGMLKGIRERLTPDGKLLLSVPAHAKDFGPTDVWAGHVRRYDEKPLREVLENSGFTIEVMWCYGFPLSNLTQCVRNIVHKNHAPADNDAGTKKSGIDKSLEARVSFLFTGVFLFPFVHMQKLFFQRPWGTGWLVQARLTNPEIRTPDSAENGAGT